MGRFSKSAAVVAAGVGVVAVVRRIRRKRRGNPQDELGNQLVATSHSVSQLVRLTKEAGWPISHDGAVLNAVGEKTQLHFKFEDGCTVSLGLTDDKSNFRVVAYNHPDVPRGGRHYDVPSRLQKPGLTYEEFKSISPAQISYGIDF